MVSTGFSFFLNRTRDPGLYPRHKHDCCEIVFYIDAEGSTFIGDQEIHLDANTLALIPANTSHTDRYLCTSQIYCVGFFAEDSVPPTVITDRENDFLVYFQEIEKELKRNANNGNAIINHCVDIILLKFLRHNQIPDTDSNINQRLEYTAQYIKSNYTTDIDFQKLATSIGYSYDHFRHMFTETYGYSPKQYMLTARIAQAKNLLRNTDEKIKTIALDCGFRQSSQFVSAFGKHVGMTPADYRCSPVAKTEDD